MEPMVPRYDAVYRSELPSKVQQLERVAARLDGLVQPATALVLEEHMRIVNSYYSNKIEGNNTHPREIRKAMEGDYSAIPAQRDLQLESLAHINVQKQLQTVPLLPEYVMSTRCLSDLHRMFYEELPEHMWVVERPNGKGTDGKGTETIVPGQFRLPGQEVDVGEHTPPVGDELDSYLSRFVKAYDFEAHRGEMSVIAVLAAHHRFVWIHPFIDGNGRVGRLHTDLLLRTLGLGACGLWCLSRGLARGTDYKAALARADYVRQGDRDGRGALSEGTLLSFIEYMLDVAIDQVQYMELILDIQGMSTRIKSYVADRHKMLIPGMPKLRPEAARLIERAFTYGTIPKSDTAEVAGLSDSVTKKLVQQMKEEGLLTEETSRAPLKWAIPEHTERYYLPQLSPA